MNHLLLNITFIATSLIGGAVFAASPTQDPWDGHPKISKGTNTEEYIATMHNKFGDISKNYEEGGAYYYSNFLNSFGLTEALNAEQEVIFCGSNDWSFNEMISDIQQNLHIANFNETFSIDTELKEDSTTTGIPPAYFDSSVHLTLKRNSNSVAKGRFCYDVSNKSGKVSYRTTGAELQTFCDPTKSQPQVFQDPVSGFSCSVSLDIPLKLGETRYLRQAQTINSKTVASGFAGCYKNSVTGDAEFKLIENPSTCSKANRESCNSTCDWAYKQVCDAQTMPRWGNNMCGGQPTIIFTNNVINVSSSDAKSTYNGVLYKGEAIMRCDMISGIARWVVQSGTCSPMSSN